LAYEIEFDPDALEDLKKLDRPMPILPRSLFPLPAFLDALFRLLFFFHLRRYEFQ